ncbi:type III secretion system translocon subunit SctE [Castellaniella sp. WN]
MAAKILSSGPNYAPSPDPFVEGMGGDEQAVGGFTFGKSSDERPRSVDWDAGAGLPSDSNPLVNAQGAPSIPAPDPRVQNMSLYDIGILLKSLSSRDVQVETLQRSLESLRQGADQNLKLQLQNIQEWTDRCHEAQTLGTWCKIASWAGAVLAVGVSVVAVTLSVVLTVITGGGAAPLLVVAAVGAVGVISSTVSLASMASMEAFGAGAELSFGNLVQQTVGSIMTRLFGVDPVVAENVCRIVAAMAVLAVPVLVLFEPSLIGNMVQGALSLAGVDPQIAALIGVGVTVATALATGILLMVVTAGASLASSTATVSAKVLEAAMKGFSGVIAGTSAIASGGIQVTQGALNIAKANAVRESEESVADRQRIAAEMVKINKRREEDQNELKKLFDLIEESTRAVSDQIAAISASMKTINQKIAGRMPA